jgi:hypothetical protein
MSVLELNGRVFDASTTGTLTLTSEGGAATTDVTQGLAKAWWQLDGTGTPAFHGSFNCSSVADTATGKPTVTLTNFMANTNFSHTYGGISHMNVGALASSFSASVIGLRTRASDDSDTDLDHSTATIHGDLA